MTDKLREALELIKALDVPVNIVDVMDSTAREAVEIAKAALAQQDAQAVAHEQISDGEFDADKRLMELADKIDHEQNWRLSGFDQRDRLTQEQQDRVTAGVMLRRYADLMAPDSWRLFLPKHLSGGLHCFRAATLEKAVEMASRHLRLNAAPTPPARLAAPAVVQDHSDLYAQGWVNGTQVQSLIEWCNSGCAKRADIAFTGGPSRQIAYAIEHLVKRASNLETSEGVFVPRELLAKVANALGLPYEEEHTSLRSKLLDILSFAAPAQRVPLRGEEIYDVCRRTLPGTTARFSFVPDWAIPLAHALIEAYERKNAQPKALPAPLEQQGNPYPST